MASTTPRSAARRTSWIRWLGWLAVLGLLLAAAAPASLATTADGNNGTVKIHDGATDTEPIVHNEPHVCTFHLHFFFADPFQAGAWEIQEWSPGDKGTVVLSGTYNTNPSGEDRQPEQGNYTLPDGHYKLFWGGDTNKHDKMKVFWVECAAPTETPGGGGGNATPTPAGATETPGGGGGGATETPGGGGGGATETPGGGGGGGNVTPTPAGGGGRVTEVPNLTQPPTDTVSPVVGPRDDSWRVLFVAMATLLATILGLDWVQRRQRSTDH